MQAQLGLPLKILVNTIDLGLLRLRTMWLRKVSFRMRSNRVLRHQGADFLTENSADVIQDLTLGALNHVVNA
jgi:hypothetical protein